MKTIRFFITAFLTLTVLASCKEDELTGDILTKTTTRDPGASNEWVPEEGSGQSYPFPTIIKQTFVPSSGLLDHTKCLTWKITWPEYAASYDENLIPTVMTLVEGKLNSFNFLNQNLPQTTHATTLSLYHDNKVQGTAGMWMELDYAEISENMEFVFFRKVNYSVNAIQYLVTQRPDLFDNRWEENALIPQVEDITYQQGDFFLFRLDKAGLYGGIRIVSMSPREIEVYLAVPNEEFTRPSVGSTVFK